MDTNSSGEDVTIKTRKPYTITKQRERWTEEEHNRFLEALKLYGRAWQRIEEHIGTKTAVQIRSHAQKFFSKLEKESLVKGITAGQALDIDIPPPRPKRKPSNPYPRKTSVGAPTSQVGQKDNKLISSVSSARHANEMLDLEKEPLSEEVPSVSVSSVNKNSMPAPSAIRNPCTHGGFMLSMKDASNQYGNNRSLSSDEPIENQNKLHECDAKQAVQDSGTNAVSNPCNSHNSCGRILSSDNTGKVSNPENFGPFPTNDLGASQNYPRNVPVHVLDRSLGVSSQTPTLDKSYRECIVQQTGGVDGPPNLANPAASAITENQDNASRSTLHQSFPTLPFTFNPVQNNQDDHRSFHQISSAFSSLIVSSLLQNPAAHAAASFAASFWPCGTNLGNSGDSTPSMAAVAAATVAAATAWWAAHGMLPLCTPLLSGFTCSPMPTSTTIVPSAETGHPLPINNDATTDNAPKRTQSLQDQKQEPPEYSGALQARNSSDSEESGVAKLNSVVTASCHGHEKKVAVVVSTEPPTDSSNKEKSRKRVDRSSCGSNTPSSSEVETDALKKDEREKDESKEPDANHPVSSEAGCRRSRSVCNINDSWKEVSEEGRLAFQALFNREVLPQSFSPPHVLKNKELQRISSEQDKNNAIQLDLNSKTWGRSLANQEMEKNVLLRGNFNREEGMVLLGLGQGRLRARRTGFKPYKRCSVEAKEGRVTTASGQSEEKCPKRIRLEGEASI